MYRLLSIILAGGAGERLQPLTRERTKAAVPFGGKFRIVDFTLSNCINSNIRQIFVLTQYKSESLAKHIQDGWGISSSGLGDYIYTIPAQQQLGMDWYRGTADAIRQNLHLTKSKEVDRILVLSGDHIYKMDYQQMHSFHKNKKAGLTISALRVKKEEAANRLGVLEVNKDYRLIGFEEKPDNPKTLPDAPDYALASMGIYIFDLDILHDALQKPGDDFGKEIIPAMVAGGSDIYIYDFEKENKIEDFVVEVSEGKRKKLLVEKTRDSTYWKDVGTIDSYYEASMDLVGVDPSFNLYGEKWLIRTYQRPLPPSKCVIDGKTPESMISDGCIISGGTVWKSILSPGVVVEKEALVEYSIVFDDVIIEPRARVGHTIVDKDAVIHAGASVGYNREADLARGCFISDSGIVVVPKGAVIFPI